MELVKTFFKDASGASAVEYSLLVAFIALVVIAAVTALGQSVSSKLNDAATGIAS